MTLKTLVNISTLRKIRGTLLAQKGRTALVIISVFIGVLGVVTLVTASDLLISQLQSDIRREEIPMIQTAVQVATDFEGTLDYDASLETLREQTEASDIEGRANYPFYWRESTEEGGRFRESRIVAFSEPFAEMDMQPARLVEGEYPAAGEQELVIERRMADDYDLGIGDTIEVRILSSVDDQEEQASTQTVQQDGEANLRTEQWTITGVVFQPYSQQPDNTMYAAFEDARYIANSRGFTQFVARYDTFEAAEQASDQFAQTISEQTPYIVIFKFTENPAENSYVQTAQDYTNVLTALAVVAMAVAGFLVVNVINALVVEERQQIGVMKSLGTTRLEVFLIYAGVVLVYGFMGTLPGVILGIPLGYQLAVTIGDFVNTLITGFQISALAVALGIGLGLGVPVLSAAIPVYNGTRVTILEAMTNLGISGGFEVGPIARLLKRIPLPTNVQQSLGSISQKKWRFALTVFALTIATAAFMGVSAVFLRLEGVLDEVLQTFDYQIQVEPTQNQDFERISTLINNNVDSVEAVYPGTAFLVQVDGFVSQTPGSSGLFVLGLETGSDLVDFDLKEGSAWRDNPDREGIVITTSVANQVNKGVGDSLTLRSAGKEITLPIIGVANFPLGSGFMRWQDLSRFAGFTEGAPQPNQYLTTLNAPFQPNNQVTAWGIDRQAAGFLPIERGETITPDAPQDVLISQPLANQGDFAVGDSLTLGSNGQSQEYTVGGIFSIPDQFAQQVEQDIPEDVVVFYWQELAQLENRSEGGQPVPNAILLTTTEDDPSAQEVDEVIDRVNGVLLDNGISASFTNQVEMAQQASEAILSVNVIFNIASVIMAAVGAIGLLTTLSIAVVERQREIGVMRSVGARSRTVVAQFMVEGMLVGVLAWIVAIPLAIGLAYALTELLPISGFITFSYPLYLLGVGLIGVLIIAAISSMWPSVLAARKTVSEILRYQ